MVLHHRHTVQGGKYETQKQHWELPSQCMAREVGFEPTPAAMDTATQLLKSRLLTHYNTPAYNYSLCNLLWSSMPDSNWRGLLGRQKCCHYINAA